jgi:hypothetical protein
VGVEAIEAPQVMEVPATLVRPIRSGTSMGQTSRVVQQVILASLQ